MNKKQLWWHVEDGKGYLSLDRGPDPCIDKSRSLSDFIGVLSVSEIHTGPLLAFLPFTIYDVVDALDQDAESCNCRDFVGLHRAFAVLLQSSLGSIFGVTDCGQVMHFMLRISEFGGLHGLCEARGADPGIFNIGEEFGIKKCWFEWVLPE